MNLKLSKSPNTEKGFFEFFLRDSWVLSDLVKDPQTYLLSLKQQKEGELIEKSIPTRFIKF
jgi:hypothetical protein